MTRRQREARQNLIAALGLSVTILAIGGYCLHFELTPGLNHTMHACHFISMVAVLGTFAGSIGTAFCGWFLIFGDE